MPTTLPKSLQGSRHLVSVMALTISVLVVAPGATPAVAATPRIVASPIVAASAHTSREVFGFALASSLGDSSIGYPSWNFDLLSTVAFFGLHVNGNGGFASDAGWTTWNSSTLSSFVSRAHAHGTKVLLTVILQDFNPNTPVMCAGLAHASTTVAAAVAQVKAKGVDGVNIDYEGLDGPCGTSDPYWAQRNMTAFVEKMRAGLGGSYYLSVDTYASSAIDGYGFFDVAGISDYADSLFVMAYDLEYSNYSHSPIDCSHFCLGPTGPLTDYYYNDSAVASQYAHAVGAAKVLLGVPYYGRKSCVGAVVPNAYPTSSVVADSYLDAIGEATFTGVKAGSYAEHREERSTGLERWDTWFNTTMGCTRELYFDDAVSLGKKYDLVNASGLRGVGIWTLNYGGGAGELWNALASHFARCTSATITAAPASPQGTGVAVKLTAGSTGCATAQYRFWIRPPGGAWKVVQDYSPSAAYTWTGTGAAGGYGFEADARATAATAYDAVANLTYTLAACSSAALSAGAASPQLIGASINLKASASCLGAPEYRFWIRRPGGAWAIVQDYSPASTYTWNTAGKAAGSYGLEVDVRDHGATAAYEAVASAAFALDAPCASTSLAVTPASPQAPGTTLTLTASAGACPNPRYRFWILAPGSRWSMVQDYSATSTYIWKTAGYPAGAYQLEVDARDVGSTAAYDVVRQVSDVLGTCTAARLAAGSPSPQPAGGSVALTGSASCPGTAQYRFWVRAPGGSWQIARDYSTSATFSFSAAGKPNGYYGFEVDVRDAGSTAAYETVANLAYLFDTCSAARLSPSKASPQPVGTAVVFSASATCAGTPQYRFWVKAPGGAWSIVQDYSAASTFTWSTGGKAAGTYAVEVDVRDQGSSVAYDTVANLTYALR